MRKFLSIFLLFAACVSTAQAQETDTNAIDPAAFSDWLDVTKLLQSQGVDLLSVDWVKIDPICLPLKTEDDRTEFNRCKYEKAMAQHQFRNDYAACDNKAQQIYPDGMRFMNNVTNMVPKNGGGMQPVTQQVWLPYSRQQLEQLRDSADNDCMLQLGWQNPDSWLEGKREQPLVIEQKPPIRVSIQPVYPR